MKRTAATIALALGLGACAYSTNGSGLDEPPPAKVLTDEQHERLAFVQAACGGCHAVEEPGLSPNPASPSFADIANREGLSHETLVAWLTDAHNYPEVMDFDLDPPQVDEIADYVLTLRSDSYRKMPD